MSITPAQKKTIYLCGPIANRTDKECRTWREVLKQTWSADFKFLDPMRHDYRGAPFFSVELSREIVERDLADIREADGLIAAFDGPSVGTSMEIFYAASIRKPIVLLNWQTGPLSPWLVHHVDAVTDQIHSALAMLDTRMDPYYPRTKA